MKEIIDLTYSLEEGMTTFHAHWHPFFSVTQLGRHGFEGRETRKCEIGTHTGTHIDAPSHFVPNGKTIDQIDVSKLMGEVTIVDLTFLGENEAVTREMLVNVAITKRLIFKFGWGKHWNNKKFYSNYPFFSREVAEYLVNQKVELIGLDTPSPDASHAILDWEKLGSDEDCPIHKIFLNNEIILVEYIANLEKVKNYEGWNISVMPLKIKDADGSPARVCLFR